MPSSPPRHCSVRPFRLAFGECKALSETISRALHRHATGCLPWPNRYDPVYPGAPYPQPLTGGSAIEAGFTLSSTSSWELCESGNVRLEGEPCEADRQFRHAFPGRRPRISRRHSVLFAHTIRALGEGFNAFSPLRSATAATWFHPSCTKVQQYVLHCALHRNLYIPGAGNASTDRASTDGACKGSRKNTEWGAQRRKAGSGRPAFEVGRSGMWYVRRRAAAQRRTCARPSGRARGALQVDLTLADGIRWPDGHRVRRATKLQEDFPARGEW